MLPIIQIDSSGNPTFIEAFKIDSGSYGLSGSIECIGLFLESSSKLHFLISDGTNPIYGFATDNGGSDSITYIVLTPIAFNSLIAG